MAAKKTPLDPAKAELLATAYYDGMRQKKRDAGLTLEDAIEVTTRQRKEDEANGFTPWLDEAPAETEPTPEA